MSRRRPLSRSAPRDQFEALRATEAALREADHRTSSIEMMRQKIAWPRPSDFWHDPLPDDATLTTVDEVLAAARGLLELPATAIESTLERLRQHYAKPPPVHARDAALLREASARARQSRIADSAGPALATLKEVFGYPSFRPGQMEIIEAVMGGRDCLAVMPTGAGKSVTYQIPARLKGGVTLVVSPLISLMKDQVDAMGEIGSARPFSTPRWTGRSAHGGRRNCVRGSWSSYMQRPRAWTPPSGISSTRST